MPLDLPFTNPALIMAVSISVFLVAPLLGARLKLPSLIVLILAGALVGTNGLGFLERDATIRLLGTVGLLYLMFLAGLELDLQGFRRYRNRSLIFGGISFGLPLALALAGMTLYGFGLPAALLIGAIVGSHTLLAYPIASRLGVTKNPAVTAVMGGTLLTDTLSLLVLAVIDGGSSGNSGVGLWLRLGLSLGLYVAVMLLGLPRLGRWFFRNTDAEASIRFLFLLAVLFFSAFLAQLAGAQPIIGAFLAGLVLNPLVPEQSTLMTRVRFVGNAFFIPFFLFSVGMLVDFRVIFGSLEVGLLALTLTAFVVLGKGGAALISQRIFGFSRAQGMLMAGLSIPQAAATLAVTFVGLEIGLFGESVVNAVIVLILVSCLLGSSLVERAGRQVALTGEQEDTDPENVPHRILVPLANPATAENLLDLAFLMRAKGSSEAIYPVMVVPGGEAVARAERLLAHAVVYAAEADVPVTPITRIAQNPTSGILRAAREQRVTDIILGWNGQPGPSSRMFGGVIDQTLERGDQFVLVSKLEHPISTYTRLVVVLPPLVDYSPGFFGALRTLKRVAQQLGASLRVLAVQGDTTRFENRFAEIEPEAQATFEGITGWSALRRNLAATLTPTDLVVLVSARQGTVAYTARLERLPALIAGLTNSFLIAYPSEQELSQELLRNPTSVPSALSASRVIYDLGQASYSEAVEALLDISVELAPARREELLSRLLDDEVGYAAEVLPGIVIAHARGKGVREPLMSMGLSQTGIEHRGSQHTVYVLCLLLSPEDSSSQAHLAQLAEVTQKLTHGGRISQLASAKNLDDLRAWFEGSPLVPPQREETAVASAAPGAEA